MTQDTAPYQDLMEVFSAFHNDVEGLKRELETTSDLDEVRRKAVNTLKHVDDALRSFKHALNDDARRDAFYVMTAFLDEAMIYTTYDGTARWEDVILEQQFHMSHLAGRRVFDRITECCRTYDDDQLPLIILYFLVLGLGFEGKYRNAAGSVLAPLKKELYRLICSTDPSFPRHYRRLFPAAYANGHASPGDILKRYGFAYYLLAALLTFICTIPVFTPNHSYYDVIPAPQKLLNQTEHLHEVGHLLLQHRAGVALFALGLVMLFFLGRINHLLFWPSLKSIPMHFSMGKLFALFQADLKAMTKRLDDKARRPVYLFIACNPALSDPLSRQSADQSHLIRQMGMKVLSSHSVEIEPGEQRFCGYSIFERGVVFSAPLMQAGRLAGLRFLNSMLARMKRVLGVRSLDGIIASVPYQTLAPLEGDEEKAAAAVRTRILDDLYTQVRFVQQRCRSNLPIYLLVTGCDDMSGFGAWSQSIPDEYRSQIIGWSRKDNDDAVGAPQGAGGAVSHIKARLNQVFLYLLSFAEDAGKNRQFLAFVREVGLLESRLSEFIQELLRKSKAVNGEQVMLRGVYFSGTERHFSGHDRALFLRDLFEDKIFAEAGSRIEYSPSLNDRISAGWQACTG